MLLANTFEGSSSGTTVTQGSGGNTGGASGDFFDVVQIGSGAGLTFDNAHAAHGAQALKVTTGASAALSNVEWTNKLGGTFGQIWFRVYLYRTANPTAAAAIARFFTSGAVQCGRLVISTTGKVQFTDAANTTQITTTNSITLNQWVRIEGFITGSASAGQLEIKLFNTKDSATPTETQTSSSVLNTSGSIGQAQFGHVGATQANITEWLDDISISSTAYIGPVPPVTGTGSLALFKMSMSGTGSWKFVATGSVAIHKMSMTGSGREKMAGTGSTSCKKISLTGSGYTRFSGSGSVAIPKMGLSSSGLEIVSGTGDVAIAKMSLEGTGRVPIVGDASVTLPKISIDGVGNRTIKGDGGVELHKMSIFGEYHRRPASQLFIFTAV